MNLSYNYSPFFYKRIKTRAVMVGDVGIGGDNPIRIQSMTTSNTQDTKETVRQTVELANAGCEIVRITVPSAKDAENLPNIRKELKKVNCKVPIVADIHFTPSVALQAVEYVEKIRINPGNYIDKKKFAVREYSEKEYQLEIEKMAEKFLPLVKRCKELGIAMRIGTNHGSLSDRIMNRFGDTPLGMVESALEFIRIAELESFQDIVVSMKSSNPVVMVQAYRLLVSKFLENKMDYPLHLGVTEAGSGREGRIKSIIGIGTLLEDGIGDTIRVSLTEDAIHEIPVAKKIAQKYNSFSAKSETIETNYKEFRNPFEYSRFYSHPIQIGKIDCGDKHVVRTESYISIQSLDESEIANKIQSTLSLNTETTPIEILSFGVSHSTSLQSLSNLKKKLSLDIPISVVINWQDSKDFMDYSELLFSFDKIVLEPFGLIRNNKLSFVNFLFKAKEIGKPLEFQISTECLDYFPKLLEAVIESESKNVCFSLITDNLLLDYRKLAYYLKDYDFPIVLNGNFSNTEEAVYNCSSGMGGLLLDGIGDILRIQTDDGKLDEVMSISYDILQSVRLRVLKTEFISCPSCGRTNFNIQEVTEKIKKQTAHLKEVKIAIMGCIVNGPGEMADADFGYVGAGEGKIHLYKGHKIVARSIPSEIADQKLIELIKEHGMWRDN